MFNRKHSEEEEATCVPLSGLDRVDSLQYPECRGDLVVTFAHRTPGGRTKITARAWAVGVFDARGRLLRRLQHGPWFNAPWGAAAAPGTSASSHRLLIGNFGDGIHASNTFTGKHEGMMIDDSTSQTL
jgi:hypothetical protein